MDWSWLVEVFKILFVAAVGIAGKVVYDRRFAKRPDLRYTFGAPAKFGERVYQNLEVTNTGTETTTDVRINFSRPIFDLSECQVSYDGPHNFEKTANQVAMLVPSLPPGDSVPLAVVFPPSESNIGKMHELFLSAKSKECVAKPLERRERTKSTGSDWAGVGIGITLSTVILTGSYAYFRRSGAYDLLVRGKMNASPQSREQLGVAKDKPTEIVQLMVLVPKPVAPASEAEIECYIVNLSDNPFAGLLRITAPSWADEMLFIERVNVGNKSRKLVKWKLKVPNNVQPGKYRFNTELVGETFDQPVSLRTTGMVEVRL